jgi:2,3,4,5-tetrahydropyridine-2-carboxylate N-succinyltransferase
LGNLQDISINEHFKFFDKDTLPLHPLTLDNNIRIVPGGSSIRTGSYVAPGVICMPPMYINIGAYVDEGSMIDSHALVGTCGQIGKRVHLSAASQIGGVLEPPGARPVIVEDDVLIGGNCGVYEGVLIRKRAVLGSGVILTSSTKVFDLVNETIITKTKENPLEIPESAVVIPGSRKLDTPFGLKYGLSYSSPMIIKYRDKKTDAKTALEEALR